jgi:hypothetical protein
MNGRRGQNAHSIVHFLKPPTLQRMWRSSVSRCRLITAYDEAAASSTGDGAVSKITRR